MTEQRKRELAIDRLEDMQKCGMIDAFDFAVLYILASTTLAFEDAIKLADFLV
jgi:hypothetical protein